MSEDILNLQPSAKKRKAQTKVKKTVQKKHQSHPRSNKLVNAPKVEEPQLCDICGEGHVTLQTETLSVCHKGIFGKVAMVFKTCDHCKSEYAGKKEMDINCRAMEAFRASCK